MQKEYNSIEVTYSFMLNSIDEVINRVKKAEENADYKEHDAFWKQFDND